MKTMTAEEWAQWPIDEQLLVADIELPSGRVLSPCCGVIGIDALGDAFEGCDGELAQFEAPLSHADRQHLAAIMIARWQAYAAKS